MAFRRHVAGGAAQWRAAWGVEGLLLGAAALAVVVVTTIAPAGGGGAGGAGVRAGWEMDCGRKGISKSTGRGAA